MVSRAAILALCVSTVTCLVVPASQRVSRTPMRRTSLSMSLEGMPGVSIETGDTVWDPMNLAQWRDPAEMRECELKNGRAAMLAVVGWIWPQVFGLWAANDVTTADPIAAIGQVNELAWVQILAACGMVEAADYNFKKTGSSKPFFDPLGLCPTDKAGFEKMQLRELKNARMAMIAFAGLVVHHYLPSAVPGMGSLA